MRLISLQSGSSGNSIFVESGTVRLLFDAGLSPVQTRERLLANGCDPQAIDALFISHDHSDHVRYAGALVSRFGTPLYITKRTFTAAKRYFKMHDGIELQHFRGGDAVRIQHVTVETIPTPHDAVDGVVFVIDDGEHRIGICTDVGHVFADLKSIARGVDGFFLESNFDDDMLARGNYPFTLKRRIAGPGGHISNREAAELVEEASSTRLKWLYLAHLSGNNNSPLLALKIHRSVLGNQLPIFLSSRNAATSEVTFAGTVPAFTEISHIQTPISFLTEMPIERFFSK